MASTLLPADISPHTGKRRRAPYNNNVCDYCRDSKKRCQPLQSPPSPSTITPSPPPCEACHRANIPCKRSIGRKQCKKPSTSTTSDPYALTLYGAAAQPPPSAPAAGNGQLVARVPRFGGGAPWLAPLSVRSVSAVELGCDGSAGCGDAGSFVSLRLVRDMPQYFVSYFRLVNDGLYPYLNEAEFMADYGNIVVDRVLSPDAHWAVAFHAVMAIGARMHGDVPYATHCTQVALKAVKSLTTTLASHPASRLALSYRAVLALSYYCACVHDEDERGAGEVAGLLSSAQRLLSVGDVVDRLPPDVLRLAASVPQLAGAFSVSPLPACSAADQLRYQRHAFPHDRARYHRLARRMAVEHGGRRGEDSLHALDDIDEAGEDGTASDNLAAGGEGEAHVSGQQVRDDLQRLNKELAGDTFMRSSLPVTWSIYHALTVLLRAEHSEGVKDLQRVIVFGRRAQCYLLLGQMQPAVLAYRQVVRHVALYDGPLSRYPPYSILLIRALVILQELDTAPDAARLIETGAAVLRKLATLWPALQRHLARWTSATALSAVRVPATATVRELSGTSISSPPWSPPLLLPSSSQLSVLDGLPALADLPLPQVEETSVGQPIWYGGAEQGWPSAEQPIY